MNAKALADISGVSVRTLHHYEKIGLLSPARNPENAYREYGEREVTRLQQILFFKACGFPLVKIKKILEHPQFCPKEAFLLQKAFLRKEKEKIETMLETLERSLQEMEGEYKMAQKEKFAGFDFSKNPYEEEAKRLWGENTVSQNKRHMEALSEKELEGLEAEMETLFSDMASLLGKNPDDEEVQKEMHRFYQYLNQNFGVEYSLEAFAGLGQIYVSDSRFQENIGRFAPGLSAFLAKALEAYAENQKKK